MNPETPSETDRILDQVLRAGVAAVPCQKVSSRFDDEVVEAVLGGQLVWRPVVFALRSFAVGAAASLALFVPLSVSLELGESNDKRAAEDRKLIVEAANPRLQAAKLLPPVTIWKEEKR